MKKKLAALAVFLAFLAPVGAGVGVASADFKLFKDACPAGSTSTVCKDAETNQTTSDNSLYGPNGILTTATNIVFFAVGVGSIIAIVVGGIQYITANGDAGKVKQARDIIIYALVGLVLAVVGRNIIVLVISKL